MFRGVGFSARNLGRFASQAFACATVAVVQCMVAVTGDNELEGCVAMSSLGSHKSTGCYDVCTTYTLTSMWLLAWFNEIADEFGSTKVVARREFGSGYFNQEPRQHIA